MTDLYILLFMWSDNLFIFSCTHNYSKLTLIDCTQNQFLLLESPVLSKGKEHVSMFFATEEKYSPFMLRFQKNTVIKEVF